MKKQNSSKKQNNRINPADDELQAKIEPLSESDKRKIRFYDIIAVVVVVALLFFAGRYAIMYRNLNVLTDAIKNTVDSGSLKFDAELSKANDLQNGKVDFTAKGTVKIESGSKTISFACDLDYGTRIVALQLFTTGNDALIYLQSRSATDYMRLDTAAVRYVLGDKVEVDWNNLLAGLSTDDSVDMANYYNTNKVDEAIANLKDEFSSPVKMIQLTDYSYKDGKHSFTVDSYKLFKLLAKCVRPMFKNDKSYANLIDLIEAEKEALKGQELTITFTESDGAISQVKILYSDDNTRLDSDYSANISILETGSGDFNAGTIFDKEKFALEPETVTVDVAYNRIKRMGLDTDTALSAANQALNSFVEKNNYNIQDDTIAVLYDESGNQFGYVYKKYRLNEIQYGDELYTVLQNGCEGYVMLNTGDIKVKGYTFNMYEPAKTQADDSDDYNNALLSATQTLQAILQAGYKINEGAVFVAMENGKDFQFTYQDNALYDVLSQYYYFAYDTMVKADISDIEGVAGNVELYIKGKDAEK